MLALSIALHGCSAEPREHDDEARASEAQAAVGAQADSAIGSDECHQGVLAADAVFDLGHQDSIRKVTRTGERILSATARRWILWDAVTRRRIATGALPDRSTRGTPVWAPVGSAALVRSVFLVPRGDAAHELRHTADGRVLATLPTGAGVWMSGLSEDGGYAFSLSDTHLRAWTPEGQLLFERAGNYRGAMVSAWASDLQIVRNSKEQSDPQIETVDLTGKTVRSFSVEGTFEDWFTDGRHFVVRTDELHRVFTRQGSIVREFPLPKYGELLSQLSRDAGGHGDFVWTFQSFIMFVDGESEQPKFQVFRLSDPSWSATFETDWRPDVSGDGSLAIGDSQKLRRLDFRGNELRLTEHEMPSSWGTYTSDGTGWTVTHGGTLQDLPLVSSRAAPSVLGCPPIQSLVASSGGRLAISTADRTVRVLETSGGTAQVISKVYGEGLSFTPDGRALFLTSPVRSVSLPGGNTVDTWPLGAHGLGYTHRDATVSATGEHLALTFCPIMRSQELPCVLEVTTNTGALLYQTPKLTTLGKPVFSPNARRVAVPSYPFFDQKSYVFEEGKQIARFAGNVVGWLDNEHPVISKLHAEPWSELNDYIVVDLTGKELSKLNLEPLRAPPTLIDADHLLTRNTLYRVSDGAVVLQQLGASHSARAGDEVWFAVDGSIVRRRWR